MIHIKMDRFRMTILSQMDNLVRADIIVSQPQQDDMYSCKNLLAHFQECNSDVGTATDVHIRAQLGGISYMQPREDRIYSFFFYFYSVFKVQRH